MKLTTKKILLVLASSSMLLFATLLKAQTVDEYQADREKLLQLLSTVQDSLNNKDIESVIKHIHPNAVLTFQDAHVAKGTQAIESYFLDKIGGSTPILKSFSTIGTVDAPADFYGNIAVAHGHNDDSFEFVTGNKFNLESKWTVVLIKENDQWSVIALHFSANMFDNPLLNSAKNNLLIFCLLAFLFGLLMTALFFKLRRKK